MDSVKNIIIITIFFCVVFVLFSKISHSFSDVKSLKDNLDIEKLRCIWSEKMREKSYNGIIVDKFLDSNNHLYPRLNIVAGDSTFYLYLTNERSGFYDFVLIGDSIFKEQNLLEVNINRGGEKQLRELTFNCIEK